MAETQQNNASACSAGAQKMAQDIQSQTIKSTLEKIKNKLIVMSGKGGVGKSSIAANIAVGLSNRDFKVGLMDVDLHGPSIHGIMGIQGMLEITSEKLVIPKAFNENLKVVSMQSLMHEADQAVIWRGPLKNGVIRQFISDMQWGELDYLIIDSPPGTGDEPLSVVQTIPDTRAIVVTTPQNVALADVRKSINFCKKMNMDIVGLVENMGPFRCPHCDKEIALFKKGGGKATAEKEQIPFLGTVPFDTQVVHACDDGKPTMDQSIDNDYTRAMTAVIDQILG
ncbi:MAG: ParA family protein [Candidatus Magnetoglobus multicellularis str. Araruama]|uniref:Iron-sulfur cluster carrier protein n=1 Tax=Candidatus Magnetoglobus multicellularis str. Araruama TaxID=890399 RepID=A0A1V1PDT8_9BACT|nr:MAG: ParA family protein [Candidatus Magnetoglobus multicellularis str. Araruama]